MDAQASSLQEMPLGTPFQVPFSSKCIGEVRLGQAKFAYKLKLRLRAEGAFLSESVTVPAVLILTFLKPGGHRCLPPLKRPLKCLPWFDLGFACC